MSELVSEVGVDVSKECKPILRKGSVIADEFSGRVTDVELAASAFYLQSITFLDGNLPFVPANFPRNVTSSVCLKCFDPSDKARALDKCVVNDDRVYQPGELDVNVETTSGAFGTITRGFREVNTKFIDGENITTYGVNFNGTGDLTRNGNHCAAFMVQSRPVGSRVELVYLEYSHEDHCGRLISDATKRFNNTEEGVQQAPIWNLTEGTVRTQVISCGINKIQENWFRSAVRVYRTMQLENTINPMEYITEENRFKALTVDDVYRSVLSMKVIDDVGKTGSYYEYTECGYYKFQFIAPFAGSLFIIFVLGIASCCTGDHHTRRIDIPYNSDSWFQEARRAQSEVLQSTGNINTRRRYFNFVNDEMILVGDGDAEEVRIDWASRELREAAMFDELGAGPTAGVTASQNTYSIPN